MLTKLMLEVDTEAPRPIATCVHFPDFKGNGSRQGTIEMIQNDVSCLVENLKSQIVESHQYLDSEKMKIVAIEYLKQSISMLKSVDSQQYPDQIKKMDKKGMKIIK